MGPYSRTAASTVKPPLRKTTKLLLQAILDHFNSPNPAENNDDPAFPLDPVYDHPQHPSPDEFIAPCNSVRTVWIGHAGTYTLFPTADLNRPFGVLTDPVFSRSCSPVGWPKRRVGIPFGVESLGPIDAVVISHNHYDHLDKDSIRMIEAASQTVKYFVPLGLGKWFTNKGQGIPAERIIELDWWEGVNLGGVESGFKVLGQSEKADKSGQTHASKSINREVKRRINLPINPESGLMVDLADDMHPGDPEGSEAKVKVDFLDMLANPNVDSDQKRPAENQIITPACPAFIINCTPAQHVDGRDLFFRDKGKTKCASWTIEQYPVSKSVTNFPRVVEGCRMFFGGDTGYRNDDTDPGAEFIQEIRDRFGPFNLCLIPAASGSLSSRLNLPDSLVRYMHAMPVDTIDMHKVLTQDPEVADPATSTHEKGQVPSKHKAVTIAIHHTTFDSKKGAERTMRGLRDARRDRGGVSSEWTDGAVVALQPGQWRDMAEL